MSVPMQCWIVATTPYPEKAAYNQFFTIKSDAKKLAEGLNVNYEKDIWKAYECEITVKEGQ